MSLAVKYGLVLYTGLAQVIHTQQGVCGQDADIAQLSGGWACKYSTGKGKHSRGVGEHDKDLFEVILELGVSSSSWNPGPGRLPSLYRHHQII